MSTEPIHSFVLNDREFVVLHKPSAAYLRADGRMWASLGGGLTPKEATDLALVQAELGLIDERLNEVAQVGRFYEKPLPPELAAAAADYHLLRWPLPGAPKASAAVLPVALVDVVYAPFNHNTYVCTQQGWVFMGCHATAEAALAAWPGWLAEHPSAKPCTQNDVRRPSALEPLSGTAARLTAARLAAGFGAGCQRLKTGLANHWLSEARKDATRQLHHPTAWNVLASLACVLLLLAWGAWVWHVGWQAWLSGHASFKGTEVLADTSPIRYWLVVLGCAGLGAASLDAAVQYGVEAFCRVRRMRQNASTGGGEH